MLELDAVSLLSRGVARDVCYTQPKQLHGISRSVGDLIRLRKVPECDKQETEQRWLSTQEESHRRKRFLLLPNCFYLVKTLLRDHFSDVSQKPCSQYLPLVDSGSDPFRLIEFFLETLSWTNPHLSI